MRRAVKLIVPILKIGVASAIAASTLGYAYLQYINSIIGPIDWKKDDIVSAYKRIYFVSENKATRMYYQDVLGFSVNRILYYLFYKSCCDSFNKRIGDQSIKNYQQEDIFNKVQQAGLIASNKAAHSTLFAKIQKIRAKNKENNEDRSYLVKNIQQWQIKIKTSINPTLKEESKAKVDKIYKYLIQAGPFFKDSELVRQAQSLSNIEKKYQNDYFYKILKI